MADSVVGVYNRAVSAAGGTGLISSTSEVSREAELCNLWYGTARRAVLRSAPWSSARKNFRLPLLEERTGVWQANLPPAPFRYAYSVPPDEIVPYHLESYASFIYRTHNVDGARMLCTNDRDPILLYIFDQQNVQRWDEGLHLAVVYTLAAFISSAMTGKMSRAEANEQKALEFVETARAAAANEIEFQEETMPDWMQAAGYGHLSSTRYVHQFETFRLGFLV